MQALVTNEHLRQHRSSKNACVIVDGNAIVMITGMGGGGVVSFLVNLTVGHRIWHYPDFLLIIVYFYFIHFHILLITIY